MFVSSSDRRLGQFRQAVLLPIVLNGRHPGRLIHRVNWIDTYNMETIFITESRIMEWSTTDIWTVEKYISGRIS